jgi:peptidoglycan/LPS O-acetylase OafA/YrhL
LNRAVPGWNQFITEGRPAGDGFDQRGANDALMISTNNIHAGRMPALDGLRGVAIALVLFHHFVIFGLPETEFFLDKAIRALGRSAWVGVDLFFVLSGFLITGILIDAKGKSRYLRNFFLRRSLRIFPLYFLVLGLTFLILPLLIDMGSAHAALADDQIWYWTYLANIEIAREGWSAFNAIDHFWSLAVEEQFYLVWPFVLLALGLSGLVHSCIACIIVALVFRVGLVLSDEPLAAYVLGPARMDALAVGALLALLARNPGGLERWRQPAKWMMSIAGLALLIIFFWRKGLPATDRVVSTIGYTLIAFFSGALLTLVVTSQRPGQLFSILPLRFLGHYSYGLYVFHHPIIIGFATLGFVATDLPTFLGSRAPGFMAFVLVTGGLSMLAAMLSWHLYEVRFLRLKDKWAGSPDTADGIAAGRGGA